jgi:hypothetical protein
MNAVSRGKFAVPKDEVSSGPLLGSNLGDQILFAEPFPEYRMTPRGEFQRQIDAIQQHRER